MKIIKIFFVSTIVFYSLLAITCFYSCDKTEKLNGSTWVGKSTFIDAEGDSGNTTIYISFTKDNADISIVLYYLDWELALGCGGKATYVCDKNDITLKVTLYSDNPFGFSNQWTGAWTGSFDKNTMTLNDVFGETVRFTKQ